MKVATTGVLGAGGHSAREPAFLARLDREKEADCEAIPEVVQHRHEVSAVSDLHASGCNRAHAGGHDRGRGHDAIVMIHIACRRIVRIAAAIQRGRIHAAAGMQMPQGRNRNC